MNIEVEGLPMDAPIRPCPLPARDDKHGENDSGEDTVHAESGRSTEWQQEQNRLSENMKGVRGSTRGSL
jgi:hypothetical protein